MLQSKYLLEHDKETFDVEELGILNEFHFAIFNNDAIEILEGDNRY